MSMESELSFERGEVAVSHAFMLGTILVLAISVVGAGIGPVEDRQGELSALIISDEFEQFDEEIGTTIDGQSPKRKMFFAPPGRLEIGPETTITIESDESGGKTEQITTAQFRFQQDAQDSATEVIYDAGLIAQKQSATATPFVLSPPRQTSYTAPSEDLVLLNMVEYNLSVPITRSSSVGTSVRFDVIPDGYNSTTEEFESNPRITVEGTNAASWERFFSANENYNIDAAATDLSANVVEAELNSGKDLHLNSQTVKIGPQ